MSTAQTRVKQRVEYIDIAKAIAIYLVILGHAVASDTLIKNVVYSFHMPLFFMLSGMVIRKRNTCRLEIWKNVIRKKFYALIIPYFIWACIYAEFSFKNLIYITYGSRETLVFADSLTSLWFLPTMFISGILSEVIICISKDLKRNIYISVVCTFGLAILLPHIAKYGYPWGFDVAIMATVFMLLGYIIRGWLDCCKPFNKPLFKYLILLICALIFCIGVKFSDSSVGYVLMANAIYGNPLIFLLNAVSGSLLIVIISFIITKINFGKNILLSIGENTLGIFLVHKPIVELLRRIVISVGMSYNFFVVVIVSAAALALSYVVVITIAYFAPFLLGKQKNGVKE